MMVALRGVPAIYSGDEQGFVGDGNDRDAREDMFASKVASYNDNRLLGTDTTTATDHYGHANPLFRQIAALSAVRRAQPALTRGVQKLRAAGDPPGLLAISRFDPSSEHTTELQPPMRISDDAFCLDKNKPNKYNLDTKEQKRTH